MKKMIIPLFLIFLLAACSAENSRPPNIILVSVDTLRWDYLETYGYPDKAISPTVSWLALNGSVFEQAVVTAGTTVPSHGSMLTGLYPRMHGARSNYHALYPKAATVTEALSEAGYQTGAFVSVNSLIRVGELGRGFQHQSFPFNDEEGPAKGWPRSGARTVEEASKWLATVDKEKPVFLWLHLWEPHGPYDMTDWARKRLEDYDGFLKDGASMEDLLNRTQDIVDSEEHVKALQTLYAGEVNLADQYLGQFFDVWKSNDLLSDTVVIFTSDHGQGLGERKRMGHGAVHAEHVIRVPLILSDFRAPKHQRIQTRVGAMDFAATIAELAGLDKKFDWIGYSLLHTDALDPNKPYYVEVELRTNADTRDIADAGGYDPNAVGVWSGDFKVVSSNNRVRMFATASDNRFPRLINQKKEPILFDYLSGLVESFQETELDMTESTISEDQLKELQGLGYVQ